MKQPNDLELLILPYLCGELAPQERQRVENAISNDPEYARLVEEFRETLAFMDNAEPPIPDGMLLNLEERIYREVVARSLETSQRKWGFLAGLRRRLPTSLPGFGRFQRWSPMAGYASLVAAGLVFGVYVGEQRSVPAPFAPVAVVVQPPKKAQPVVAKTTIRHEEFFEAVRTKELDEARLNQYAKGDVGTALAIYDQILQENPNTSASRVAEEELTSILEASRPLVNDDSPVFLVNVNVRR